MAEKEWQTREKVVQRMSRDGLEEKNLADETVERISKRAMELHYGAHEEEHKLSRTHADYDQPFYWKKKKGKQNAGRRLVREYREQDIEDSVNNETFNIGGSRKTSGASRRRLKEKPATQRLRFDKNTNHRTSVSDNDLGENNSQGNSRRHELKYGRRREQTKENFYASHRRTYGQRKMERGVERQVFRYEDDNLSMDATHSFYRQARRMYRKHRFKKGREKVWNNEAGRLGQKSSRAKYHGNIYQWKSTFYSPEYTADKNKNNTQAEEKNVLRKLQQKRNQRKIFQEKQNESIQQRIAGNVKTGAKKLAVILSTQKKIIFTILTTLMVILFLYLLIASLCILICSLAGNFAGGTVQSDYSNISDIEGNFKQMEAELDYRIDHIEEEYPDYDEYRYDIDEIGHSSTMLISYFGAKYGYFTYESVAGELMDIFNEMYELKLEEEIETHYKTVNGQKIPYNYYILNVTLKVKKMEDILENRLTTEDEKKQWKLYQETAGAQQVYGSPFEFDWRQNISSPFGYRVHPISGDLKFHSGVDIAVPKGTPIHSCMNGQVVSAGWSDSYGYNVVIENSTGYQTKYAHCSKLLVSSGQTVKRGTVIAEVGSTGNSTGNHLHLECKDPSGKYMDPLYMVSNLYIAREEDEDE